MQKQIFVYKTNITELPLEILEKITLFLGNIWDLEWLVCAYMLEDLKHIQLQRYQLTITKDYPCEERRKELLFNTKFISEKLCHRRKRKFEGLFDNFLLVGNVMERDICVIKWRNHQSIVSQGGWNSSRGGGDCTPLIPVFSGVFPVLLLWTTKGE